MTQPRPWLLDLFAGAGGCSVGYERAGFQVEGVDIEPHDDYPFTLTVADAMAVLADRDFLDTFEVIHASPPCPRYSSITPDSTRMSHPDLVGPVREALIDWGGLYVIENVPGAPLVNAAVYCGKAMGLPEIRRHRLFESNVFLMTPPCACDNRAAYGIYGDHGDKTPRQRPDGYKRWGKARDVLHAQQIMGIDWMSRWDDLADAIPPVYTQHIGEQLIERLSLVSSTEGPTK